MAEQSELLLRHVLEASYSGGEAELASNSALDRANFIKMQTAYKACMNEEVIKSAGVRPLLSVLRKVDKLYHTGLPDAEEEGEQRKSNQVFGNSIPQAEDQLSAVVLFLIRINLGSLVDIYTGVSSRLRLTSRLRNYSGRKRGLIVSSRRTIWIQTPW